jgi:hypothetical protein
MHHFTVDGATVNLLGGPCTTGHKEGHRLDGWLSVPKDGNDQLYQVELKSWSFYGAGGGDAFLLNCDSDEFERHTIAEWGRCWDGNAGRFRADNLDEVFVPMKSPAAGASVTPLACLWAAVNPTGSHEPFFRVSVIRPPFDHVDVFSASIYLQNLLANAKCIELELPETEVRIEIFPRLFEVLKDSN